MHTASKEQESLEPDGTPCTVQSVLRKCLAWAQWMKDAPLVELSWRFLFQHRSTDAGHWTVSPAPCTMELIPHLGGVDYLANVLVTWLYAGRGGGAVSDTDGV